MAHIDLESIPKLTALNNEQLHKIELELAQEFSQVTSSLLSSRLIRIDYMIDLLNTDIQRISNLDSNWNKLYQFEIDTIKSIKNNCENILLVNEGQISFNSDIITTFNEYETELNEVINCLKSPELFNINTFPLLFNSLLKKYKISLSSIINEKNYQINLINKLNSSNSLILWNQYLNNINSKKRQLIDLTIKELYNLNLQHNNNNKTSSYINHYYKSKLSPSDIIPNNSINTLNSIDLSTIINNNNDNNALVKNIVELNDTRKNILINYKKFTSSQSLSNKRVKLNSCVGLSENQIVDDLLDLNQSGEFDDQFDDGDGYGGGDGDQSDDQFDQSDEILGSEDFSDDLHKLHHLRHKYESFLGVDKSPNNSLELPPLEAFPQLNGESNG